MPDKSERAISLDILGEVLNDGAYNSIALLEALDRHSGLARRERAFITELTNGTLRNLILIDYIISQYARFPAARIKPVINNILRLSIYELMFMRTPDFAVCMEAVRLTKARGLKGLSGFVNGVLRNVARNKDGITLPDKAASPAKFLSVLYSHPLWIVERWLKCYGYDFVKEMLEKNNQPPEVAVCVNTLKISDIGLLDALAKEGVTARRHEYSGSALLISGTGAINKLDSYKKGLFHVQDLASQIAVMALAPKKGQTVVDLCAAPGGKSFFSACLMENQGIIYSRDIHAHKIKLIKKGAERLGIDIIRAEERDAALIDERLTGKADMVIVDAPCSGLGIIRKKPDIKLNRREADIKILQGLQRRIMAAGARYVKKGGFMLYSTCTLTDEENTDNARWFCENQSFEPVDITPDIPECMRSWVAGCCLTLFPHIHNTDGFFISKFIKRG